MIVASTGTFRLLARSQVLPRIFVLGLRRAATTAAHKETARVAAAPEQAQKENQQIVQHKATAPLVSPADGDLDGVELGKHFRSGTVVVRDGEAEVVDYRLPHPIWSREEMDSCDFDHHCPQGFVERAAHVTVMTLRRAFDLMTGYSLGFQGEKCMLRRVMFLETVAGVPGMVGAMSRHLLSLRKFKTDRGWIHTLLEEAENERMHLMIALRMRDPSFPIRATVLAAQGLFFWWYTVMYAISPRYCHRFVGYLEEQAVHTYTNIVNKIDEGLLPGFTQKAPASVRNYYRLPQDATIRDVFLAIRADENHHREVNHAFAAMGTRASNPFRPGY